PAPEQAQQKSNAKLFAMIGIVVVLAVVGWFVWGRSTMSDPLVGCWQWFNNAPVTIRPDGTMQAGPFTAQWRFVDSTRQVYNFTWPEAVDQLTLSADGRTLRGGNQYGFNTTATRVGFGGGLEGAWRWPNGAIVLVQPGGIFTVGTITGRWRSSDVARRG